jgi:hypothetical protein
LPASDEPAWAVLLPRLRAHVMGKPNVRPMTDLHSQGTKMDAEVPPPPRVVTGPPRFAVHLGRSPVNHQQSSEH